MTGEDQGAGKTAAHDVALVIPCFNDGEFIPLGVESARSQGAGQVIVVDDGSTDPGTHEALDRLEAEGVTVVRQQNQGVSAARMAGVAAVEAAPYVQSLDSDDQMAPGVLGRMAAMLDADPGLDVVWGDVESFGERRFISTTWDGLDPWRLTFLNEIPVAAMFRRSSLIEVGGWEVDGYEDWDLFLKGAEHGWRGARIDDVSVRYRQQATTRRLDLLHAADEDNRAELRRRHARLFADRAANRRRSSSKVGVKLAWTLIDALPVLSGRDKARLIHRSRDLLEPRMARRGV